MKTAFLCLVAIVSLICTMDISAADAQKENKMVKLPAPEKNFSCDLAVALQERHSSREYGEGEITDQELSNLLWAANGVNREDGKHTSPTPMGMAIIKIYVIGKDGVDLYVPAEHALKRVSDEKLVAKIGMQPYVATADKVFLFVFDTVAAGNRVPLDKMRLFAYNAAGCMEQNLGLAAAAQKLGSVVVASVKADVAKKEIPLPDGEEPMIIMPVGRLK